MCGIIGYVGSRHAKDLLIGGLERLEFRGYDSAGIALTTDGGLEYVRAVGNIAQLKELAGSNGSQATTGLGHTRWATHGGVNEDNAHPLTGCDESELAIVLNGIVENYRELKAELEEGGHVFSSETDAEVVAHLLETAYEGDLVAAVRTIFDRLEGHFTFVVIHRDEPGRLVGVRCETPLVVGLGEGENFLASNLTAFLSETHRVVYPANGEIVEITADSVRISRADDGSDVPLEVREIDWDDEVAEREGYETFMLKEIYEQPEGVRETIGDRIRHGVLVQDGLGLSEDDMRELRRIVIVACGTAYHAGVVGRYVIEEWARVPVEPDVASEWIYRNPVLVTRTGLEVGVAASKTFSAQVALMYLIGLELARQRGTLPPGEIEFILDQVWKLPAKMQVFLDGNHPIDDIAERFYQAPFFLFLGRHIGLPVALEGALKLKEISYIPTEAYSAGEMKHGPIALLEEGTPVVVVATRQNIVYDKVVSNIQECRARGAHVIAIATEGNEDIQHHANDVIYVPKSPAFLQAALATVPLQLLAYKIARLRGHNVDQPRNLAKTVTVE